MQKLQTLQSLIARFREYDDRPALIALRKAGSERRSYAEMETQVRQLALGLADAGIARGKRIALLAENRPEWTIACMAVIQTGAAIVPLDVQLADKVLKHVLKDSGARLLFTTTAHAERLEQLDFGSGIKQILLDAPRSDSRSWQRLLVTKMEDLPRVGPDNPAALFYTSGTTGLPKGVPLNHGNLAFQLNALAKAEVVTEKDRILLPLPFHHVYPFVGMLTALAFGLPIILPQALTGPQIIRAVNEEKVTVVLGVPRLYRALLAGVKAQSKEAGRIAAMFFSASAGLSRLLRRRMGLRFGKLLLRPLHQRLGPQLRVLVSGGAPLDADLAWELEGLGWQIATGYGLTETAPMLTLDAPGKARIGSVGRPLPGVEIRIEHYAASKKLKEQGRKVTQALGDEGEIVARGPGVFAGYLNLPEKTNEAFTADGWFRTGDLGYVDSDGYVYVTGRVSTRITTEGGKKFQPDDVEEAYQQSPDLREVGLLQEDGKLVALVLPEAGASQDGADIDKGVRDAINEQAKNLPSYQHVTEYAVTRDPLPRTQLGKIRRQELVERYERAKKGAEPNANDVGPIALEEMSDEDRRLLEDPAAKEVWEWLIDRYQEGRLTPDTNLQLDLGIDSMEWLNLTLEIRQRVGVELNDEAIGRIETIRDLWREVAGQENASEEVSQDLWERPEQILSDQQRKWLEPLSPVQAKLATGLFAVNRRLMHGLFGLRVHGLENVPEQGSFVLAPNHISYLDSFALAAALDHHLLRQTYWAGWKGVAFGNPVTRLISRLAQVVPIDPEHGVIASLAFALAVLKRGHNLVWYPEGERSITGELQPFKTGIGILLDRVHVNVVPVFLHGTYEALPPGKTFPRLVRIAMWFGEPQQVAELERQGKGEQASDRIAHALHECIMQLGRDAQPMNHLGREETRSPFSQTHVPTPNHSQGSNSKLVGGSSR